MATTEMATPTPMAAEEEADDQSSVKSDDSVSNRVKFLCSYGGKILPRPVDGKLRYAGGEIRVVAANRSITYADLIAKLEKVFGSSLSLKLQLPTEDLDALVSITSDDDLENMLEEYERMEAKEASAKVRAFLFPAKIKPTVAAGSRGSSSSLEQRFVDAVNGAPTLLGSFGDDQFSLDVPGALCELDLNKRRIHPTGREETPGAPNFPIRCCPDVSGSTPPRHDMQQEHRTVRFQLQPHDGRHVEIRRVGGEPQFPSRYVQCAPVAGNKLAANPAAPRGRPPSQQAASPRVVGFSPCAPPVQPKSPLRYAIRTATQTHRDRVVKPAQPRLTHVIAEDPWMGARLVCVDRASAAYVAYGGPRPPVQVRFPGRPTMVPSSSGWSLSDSSRGGICQGRAS